jgi:hypothetical protein
VQGALRAVTVTCPGYNSLVPVKTDDKLSFSRHSEHCDEIVCESCVFLVTSMFFFLCDSLQSRTAWSGVDEAKTPKSGVLLNKKHQTPRQSWNFSVFKSQIR